GSINRNSTFYPERYAVGECVRGDNKVFQTAEYHGTYSPNHNYATVYGSRTTKIKVRWITRNRPVSDQTPDTPPPPTEIYDLDNVIVFESMNEHATLEIADRVTFKDAGAYSNVSHEDFCMEPPYF
ncbi:954_t:CDS:2, partial [Paraglomus occultum]